MLLGSFFIFYNFYSCNFSKYFNEYFKKLQHMIFNIHITESDRRREPKIKIKFKPRKLKNLCITLDR